jgi:hypothetical protein
MQIPESVYWAFIIHGLWRMIQNRNIIKFYPLHLLWIVAVILNIVMAHKSPGYTDANEHTLSLVGNWVISIVHVIMLIILFPDIRPNDGWRFNFLKYVMQEKRWFYNCLIGITLFSLFINYYLVGFTQDFINEMIIKAILCFGYIICMNDKTKLANYGMYFITVGIQVYYLFFR